MPYTAATINKCIVTRPESKHTSQTQYRMSGIFLNISKDTAAAPTDFPETLPGCPSVPPANAGVAKPITAINNAKIVNFFIILNSYTCANALTSLRLTLFVAVLGKGDLETIMLTGRLYAVK